MRMMSVFSVLAWETQRCRHRNAGHYIGTFKDTCYMFVADERHWDEARDFCWHAGAEMLAIRDKETMDFIRTVLDSRELGWNRNGVWNGLSNLRDRGWEWTTGLYLHLPSGIY